MASSPTLRHRNRELNSDNNNGNEYNNSQTNSPTTEDFIICNLTEKPDEIPGLRGIIARELIREIPLLQKIQSYRNRILDIYFFIATSLGDEIFYITFLPISCWIISPQLSVYVTWNLCLGICGGNCIKNHFCIPRPPHPPIWSPTKPERDHGFLSTHTVSSVTIPICTTFYYYFDTHTVDHLPVYYVILFIIIWSGSISFSRIYNGFHSIQDVVCGYILGIVTVIGWALIGRVTIDCWIDSNNSVLYKIMGLLLSGIFLLMLHPKPNKPFPIRTAAREESALVVGTAIGTSCSFIFNRHFNLPASIISPPDLQGTLFQFALQQPYLGIARVIFGFIVVLTTRQLAKKFFNYILEGNYSTRFMGLEKEILVKYLVYNSLAVSVVVVMPLIYWSLGLQSSPDYTTLERTLCI